MLGDGEYGRGGDGYGKMNEIVTVDLGPGEGVRIGAGKKRNGDRNKEDMAMAKWRVSGVSHPSARRIYARYLLNIVCIAMGRGATDCTIISRHLADPFPPAIASYNLHPNASSFQQLIFSRPSNSPYLSIHIHNLTKPSYHP
jgi:hypothetical protein